MAFLESRSWEGTWLRRLLYSSCTKLYNTCFALVAFRCFFHKYWMAFSEYLTIDRQLSYSRIPYSSQSSTRKIDRQTKTNHTTPFHCNICAIFRQRRLIPFFSPVCTTETFILLPIQQIIQACLFPFLCNRHTHPTVTSLSSRIISLGSIVCGRLRWE